MRRTLTCSGTGPGGGRRTEQGGAGEACRNRVVMSALISIDDDVYCFLNGAFFEVVMTSIKSTDPPVAAALEEAIAVNFMQLECEEPETREKLRRLIHERFEELLRRGADDPISKEYDTVWPRYKESVEEVVHMFRTGTSPPPPDGPVRAK